MNADIQGYKYLQDYLTRNGYRYKESNDLMTFKIEGEVFLCNMHDAPAVQICQVYELPNLEHQELLEVVNKMNRDVFVVKFYLDYECEAVFCCYECNPEENASDGFWEVAIGMLRHSGKLFVETVKSLKEE